MDFSLAIEVTYPGSDYIAICQLAFEWADSYDKKDWNRLRNILAPNLMVLLCICR